jgi:Sel1 repeat-containing protein
VRCPQCASENPVDYRFCGMCGTPLESAAPVSEPMSRSAASRPEEQVTVPAERASRVERFTPSRSNGGSSLLGLNDTRSVERAAPQKPIERVASQRPVQSDRHVAAERPAIEERIGPPPPSTISGPSFLGLGAEPPHGGYGETSRDLNYLFEDDEQPKRTYWRFTAIMLVLAICGGLAYLQYRRGGNSWTAPWSKGPAQTPVQASQSQPGDQANTGAAPSANNAAAPSGQTPTGDQPPNAPDKNSDGSLKEKDLPPQGGQAATSGAAGAGSTEAQGAAAKDEKTSKSSEDTTETAAATPPPATGAKESATGTEGAEAKGGDARSAATKDSGSAAAAKDNTEETADVAKPAKPTRTKPAPQVAPASPDDALVTNAEKYLYGRGVPQNCDRALISLRAAANRQNSRAMTLLGTMYGTGHCVSRDLPNSYRWFAQASRQSPDNTWITRNLEMIWREMTPAERQLATARQ